MGYMWDRSHVTPQRLSKMLTKNWYIKRYNYFIDNIRRIAYIGKTVKTVLEVYTSGENRTSPDNTLTKARTDSPKRLDVH